MSQKSAIIISCISENSRIQVHHGELLLKYSVCKVSRYVKSVVVHI